MIVVTAMLLTALVWAPFLRGVTRSVRRLESATAQIAEGRFDQVPTVNRHDELGRLAKSIQQMAARLNTLVSGQKRFLGDTAHELRSPLGRMQVALEILERGAPAQDRELIGDLRDDVTAMSRLTDDLLEFAHAELAKDGLALEAVSVDEVVRDAVRSERRPGAEISVDVATGLYVMADRRHLKRAIANALRNAIEHAGSAGPVTVTARPADEQIEIAIADSGPGVPDDALDRVFAPFFRLDTSRARQTGGAGLGLAIVRSSIEACRGTVRCSNRRPTGLQVTLTVPAA
jgi:two-component system sensor histidine kinase CpxA